MGEPTKVPHVLFPGLQSRPGSPPHTPHPQRKALERDHEKPTRTPKGIRPPRPVLGFDYDADEGSSRVTQPPEQPPEQRPQNGEEEEDPEQACGLRRLLQRWEADLNRFRDKVLEDLEDYKRRLGIHS
ncbi:E1^E4 [Human papillomavirus 127]|uniref:E1^E4 n=1 Tax=Human papillomavirus 127 TaxID=746832 RepID=E0YDP6_9PAPI|nr:E1^E4 [Human papillomavirus 127]ADE45486.1 E1^E4 [Human papillomavirus 127]